MERDLIATGVDVRLNTTATATDTEGFDRIIVATGALPYAPPLDSDLPFRVVQAWAAIAAPATLEGPILVADWGGEYSGVDAAETLARAGHDVQLACAALMPGAQVHQYARALYLGRLDELGVRIRHHMELVQGARALRHVFSYREEAIGAIGTLVLAQGRRPDDALWRELESQANVTRIGDILSPRGLEEAVLEGVLAFHEVPA